MKLNIDGRTAIEECEGNGPVDATFNCTSPVPHDATLELYQVHAVTQGTDAQAEVSVRLSEERESVTAKGAIRSLVASANAYLGALNKLMVKRLRGKPSHGGAVGGAVLPRRAGLSRPPRLFSLSAFRRAGISEKRAGG